MVIILRHFQPFFELPCFYSIFLEIVGAEEVVANEETIAEETVEEAPEETIEGLKLFDNSIFLILLLENIASEEIIQSEGIGEEVSVGNDDKKDNDSDDSDNDDNDNDLKKPVDNLNSDSGQSDTFESLALKNY